LSLSAPNLPEGEEEDEVEGMEDADVGEKEDTDVGEKEDADVGDLSMEDFPTAVEAFHPGRKVDCPETSFTSDSAFKTTKKKRVSWNTDLEEVFEFEPLPPLSPENDEDADPKPWKKKRKSWGEFWKKPDQLAPETLPSFTNPEDPMSFIQPGSKSVEKQLRETSNALCWFASSSLKTHSDSVLEAAFEAPDFCPLVGAPKEIPLEEAPPQDPPPQTENVPFSSPNQYDDIVAKFPSPPYSI